jgi:hypothetical protein
VRQSSIQNDEQPTTQQNSFNFRCNFLSGVQALSEMHFIKVSEVFDDYGIMHTQRIMGNEWSHRPIARVRASGTLVLPSVVN